MTKEQIEKAAQQHADELRVSTSIPGTLVPMLHDLAKSSYICGVQDTLASQWISAEDQMPKLDEEVLTYTTNNVDENSNVAEYAVACFDGEDWFDTHGEHIRPHYWLPIPQLNSKKEKDDTHSSILNQ